MDPLLDRLARGPIRDEPPDPRRAAPDRADAILLNRLNTLVGGAALAIWLWPGLVATLRADVCFRTSISHFYYDPWLGAWFVGCLMFIGAFMIAYRGEVRAEDRLTTFVGLCAMVVALVPAADHGCPEPGAFAMRAFVEVTQSAPPVWQGGLTGQVPGFVLYGWLQGLHFVAAAIVLLFLAWYCLFVLTREVPRLHHRGGTLQGPLIPTKRRRNLAYRLCGTLILLALAVLGGKSLWLWFVHEGDQMHGWDLWRLTFWFESLALGAFGAAWLIKGRRVGWLNDIGAETRFF